MTTDTGARPADRPTVPTTPAVPTAYPPAAPRVLVLDPAALADPVGRERALVELIRYQNQVLTARHRLEAGDRVRLLEPLHTSWIDQDLAAEEYWEEDARITADLPAGTPGVITLVRRYPTPWPYVVAFDNGPECGGHDLQITRCADPAPTPDKPPVLDGLDLLLNPHRQPHRRLR
ncbi:hypothetical protein [Kitasatospora sp. NPDC094011]|uniref:hypothetical protein n=1 Tax=Kitasatospora sp. NPDC094011 TaxID=3364090 RepID=UPI00381AD600